jgi:hypothetical protein
MYNAAKVPLSPLYLWSRPFLAKMGVVRLLKNFSLINENGKSFPCLKK